MASTRLSLHVQPKAAANEIVGFDDVYRLKVRVTAPPSDGAANTAVIRLLSGALHIPKSAIVMERGHNARIKLVRIEGVTAVDVGRLLRDD